MLKLLKKNLKLLKVKKVEENLKWKFSNKKKLLKKKFKFYKIYNKKLLKKKNYKLQN